MDEPSAGVDEPSAGVDKANARAAARRARSGCRVDEAHLVDRVRGLVRRVQPARVAAYASYRDEPDTAAVIADLLSTGIDVVLPRREGDDLTWIGVGPGTDYDVDDRGIREPRGLGGTLADVDVVLLPALGVSRAGDRLGQGGGFYDRALAPLPRAEAGGPLLIAVVYAHELVAAPTWPTEPHDIRVDDAIAVPCGHHHHHDH